MNRVIYTFFFNFRSLTLATATVRPNIINFIEIWRLTLATVRSKLPKFVDFGD